MPVALNQPKRNLPSSPSLCAGRKFSNVEKALVFNLLHEEPQCPRCPFHKFAASQAAARLYGLGG